MHTGASSDWLKAVVQENGIIIVPVPALTEILVHVHVNLGEFLRQEFKARKYFRLAPLGERAAVEAASGIILSLDHHKAQSPAMRTETKPEIKYDHMIIGIAKASGAQVIYTTDRGMAKHAEMIGMSCKHIGSIAIPDSSRPPVSGVDLQFCVSSFGSILF